MSRDPEDPGKKYRAEEMREFLPGTMPDPQRWVRPLKKITKELTHMGDFVQHTEVKSAVRALANPIENIASFDALVQSVVSTNPFGCVSYISAGTTHAPVETSM